MIRLLFHDPPKYGRTPAIFLDRDGVINERIVDGYVTSWHDFHSIDGIESALRSLTRLRLPIIVVSNQAGVGKGLMGRRTLKHITCRFVEALERHGCRLDAVYCCPHRPEDACGCRKPKPGLLLQAARDWRVDLARSVMVGDSRRDLEAAQAAGCAGILLNLRAAAPQGEALEPVSVHNVLDLPHSVASILGRAHRTAPGRL